MRKYLLATTAVCLAGLVFIVSCGREAPFYLPVLTGELEVVSSVPGADIFLNGLPTGYVTPDTIPDLEINTYRVSVSLASHAVDPSFIDLQVGVAVLAGLGNGDGCGIAGAEINILVGIVNEVDAMVSNTVDTAAIFMGSRTCVIGFGDEIAVFAF